MPETFDSKPQPPAGAEPRSQSQDAGHIPMTEEMDSAKWSLPPFVPILGAMIGVGVIVALLAFTMRAKPVSSGAITKVAAADQQSTTIVAVQAKLDNKIEKQLWIKDIRSELETADGKKYEDHASPAQDVERYMKIFPPLQEAQADILHEELKIPPGSSFTGSTVFAYPVDKATFDGRKSLTLRIEMYDQPTLVLHQP